MRKTTRKFNKCSSSATSRASIITQRPSRQSMQLMGKILFHVHHRKSDGDDALTTTHQHQSFLTSSVMTIGGGGDSGGVGVAVSSRSNSRTGRSNRYSGSQSKLRPNNNNSSSAKGGGGTSTLGGGPLNGAAIDEPPGSPTKRENIKHRFEITKKLGSGTYGKVSLAYDHKTEREVAVKLIKKSAIENKQDLVRIRREIRIMSALHHPNIIQIYEVFENKDKIILVMEYASGGELYDYVSTYGSLPEPEARRIFRQIVSAVLYCHKHKVAHRDLKLENILLDGDSNAKIADFGLSNYFSEKSLLTTFCGSPLYASPEIINGTPYRGPEVDCWSLGILLYTLVYGSMPFDGRDFNRMVRQIKRGAYFEPDTPSSKLDSTFLIIQYTAASMLIRNMLRVNPERRSDIDEIASHWWLNLEENMPVIQELPENQITDHTPLTERAETMVVQDLADETDVFMEFGHLCSATRKKIEEFRRRRKDADEFIDQSPIKPPKARKTDENSGGQPEMTNREKNLRADVEPVEPIVIVPSDTMQDPLERLKMLESRLRDSSRGLADRALPHTGQEVYRHKPVIANKPVEIEPFTRTAEHRPLDFTAAKTTTPTTPTTKTKLPTPPNYSRSGDEPMDTVAGSKTPVHRTPAEINRPSFVPLDSPPITRPLWRVETDTLNILMNQVLEQMEKGPVSLNLVARIKAHPLYDQRPMVKELLESILDAQPAAVQKQASKIIQQQSQDLVRRQLPPIVAVAAQKRVETSIYGKEAQLPDIVPSPLASPTIAAKGVAANRMTTTPQKTALEERPWHSVEVGFDPDDERESSELAALSIGRDGQMQQSTASNATEETVRDVSIDEDLTEFDRTDSRKKTKSVESSQRRVSTAMSTKSSGACEEEEDVGEDEEEEEEEEEEEDEEEFDSDFEELADEVEQVEEDINNASYTSVNSKQDSEQSSDTAPPPDPPPNAPVPSVFLDAFDRGLIKRQSKGKYQCIVDLYGRGVSCEVESPQMPRRRIGGPQPLPEHSPFLFDKAKRYILEYPDRMPDSDEETKTATPELATKKQSMSAAEQRKMSWLRTQDPDIMTSSIECASHSATPTNSQRGSAPPKKSPPHKTVIAAATTIRRASESSEEESEEEEDAEPIYATPTFEQNTGRRNSRTNTIFPLRTMTIDKKSVDQKPLPIVLQPPPVGRRQLVSLTQSAPASIHNTPSPDRDTVYPSTMVASAVAKHYVTVAELKLRAPMTTSNITPLSPTTGNTAAWKASAALDMMIQGRRAYAEQRNNALPLTDGADDEKDNNRKMSDLDISDKYPTVAASRIPAPVSPTSPSSTTSSAIPTGIQPWETASAYIRRKNRERRQRNRTIGAPEEALAHVLQAQRESEDDRRDAAVAARIAAAVKARFTPPAVVVPVAPAPQPPRPAERKTIAAVIPSTKITPSSLQQPKIVVAPQLDSTNSNQTIETSKKIPPTIVQKPTPIQPIVTDSSPPKQPTPPTTAAVGDVAKSIDPFYYHTRARDSSSTADASLFNYVRPRLHDDSYRKRSIGDNTTPITTTIDDQSTIVNRFGFTSKRDETRAKSKSLHDLSPPDRTNLLDDIYHHHAPPSVPVRTSPGYNSYEPRKHAPTATSTTPSYFSAVRRHHTMVGYEDEVPSVLNSWANEPKRYEVYQTRAERAAERNTTGTSAATNTNHYSSSYRTNTTTPSSNWTADHRLSLHDRTTTDRPTSYTPGGAYRSRFDDNFLYRRSAYDVERELTAGLTVTGVGSSSSHHRPSDASSADHSSRFRSRAAAANDSSLLTSSTGATTNAAAAYRRSQSMDRKLTNDDATTTGATAAAAVGSTDRNTNYYVNIRNRLMSPEISGSSGSHVPTSSIAASAAATSSSSDYNYVSYHDSSGTSRTTSQPREPPDATRLPTRGILKNKASAESEPRASENGRGLVGGNGTSATSGVRYMLDRLKRHLSTEKSTSPVPSRPATTTTTTTTVSAPAPTSSRYTPQTSATSTNSAYHHQNGSSYSQQQQQHDSDTDDVVTAGGGNARNSTSKKRSILNLGRRRTVEIRYEGGKMVTNGYADTIDDSKRPNSPLEKIKGLFSRNKSTSKEPSSTTDNHHHLLHQYYSSPITSTNTAHHRSSYTSTDKPYVYSPSSNNSSTPTNYTPQYRKYDRALSTRYSYTPTSTTTGNGRHWYEETHLY